LALMGGQRGGESDTVVPAAIVALLRPHRSPLLRDSMQVP